MCLYVPSTPHACSLSDLSILLRDILICKENKHHQKDGEYKESVIIKVGGAGTSDFSPRSDALQGPPKSRLPWRGLNNPGPPDLPVMQWFGTENLFTRIAATDDAGKTEKRKEIAVSSKDRAV